MKTKKFKVKGNDLEVPGCKFNKIFSIYKIPNGFARNFVVEDGEVVVWTCKDGGQFFNFSGFLPLEDIVEIRCPDSIVRFFDLKIHCEVLWRLKNKEDFTVQGYTKVNLIKDTFKVLCPDKIFRYFDKKTFYEKK